jgi:hypothetical protein
MSLESRINKLECRAGGHAGACVCRNPTVVRYDVRRVVKIEDSLHRYDRGDSFAAAAEDRDSDTRAGAVCATCGGEKIIIRVVRVPRKFTTSEWKSHEPPN